MAKIKPDTKDLDTRLTEAEHRVKSLHDTKDSEIRGLTQLIQQITEHINELSADLASIDSIDPSDPDALSQLMSDRLHEQAELKDEQAKLKEAEKMLKSCRSEKSYLSQSDSITFTSDMAGLYREFLGAYKLALQPAIEMLTEAAVATERIRLRINGLTRSAKQLCKGQTSFSTGTDLTTYQIKPWLDLLKDFGIDPADIYHQAQDI